MAVCPISVRDAEKNQGMLQESSKGRNISNRYCHQINLNLICKCTRNKENHINILYVLENKYFSLSTDFHRIVHAANQITTYFTSVALSVIQNPFIFT